MSEAVGLVAWTVACFVAGGWSAVIVMHMIGELRKEGGHDR